MVLPLGFYVRVVHTFGFTVSCLMFRALGLRFYV